MNNFKYVILYIIISAANIRINILKTKEVAIKKVKELVKDFKPYKKRGSQIIFWLPLMVVCQ